MAKSKAQKTFLVINGPNLNKLGMREPEIYGSTTLKEIEAYTLNKVKSLGAKVEWFQSNLEGEIIEKIQEAVGAYDVLIINPAGYSHTSVAILDALKLFKGKIIEVHISNTHKREQFRSNRITVNAADSVMEGFGKDTYQLAILSQLI